MIRPKRNASNKLLERRPVNRKTGVTADHIIKVISQEKSLRLRHIDYRNPESGKRYEFLTNYFRLVDYEGRVNSSGVFITASSVDRNPNICQQLFTCVYMQ